MINKEQEIIKVYPLADSRVVEKANAEWGKDSVEILMGDNTHYCIKYCFFCYENDDHWNEDYVVCNYDDYLKGAK